MERADHEGIATFFAADEPLQPGAVLTLGEQVARHVRALRCGPAHGVWLLDGLGWRASATIIRLTRDAVAVQVHGVEEIPPLPPVHLLVPVADRDRMLWLAEKVTELGATSWRPVLWKRSRSVMPRGEGTSFGRKVRARMAVWTIGLERLKDGKKYLRGLLIGLLMFTTSIGISALMGRARSGKIP